MLSQAKRFYQKRDRPPAVLVHTIPQGHGQLECSMLVSSAVIIQNSFSARSLVHGKQALKMDRPLEDLNTHLRDILAANFRISHTGNVTRCDMIICSRPSYLKPIDKK